MELTKKPLLACLLLSGSMPLWGGTGRPSDGFLSFILLFGFLVFILGILQLIGYVKRKTREFRDLLDLSV